MRKSVFIICRRRRAKICRDKRSIWAKKSQLCCAGRPCVSSGALLASDQSLRQRIRHFDSWTGPCLIRPNRAIAKGWSVVATFGRSLIQFCWVFVVYCRTSDEIMFQQGYKAGGEAKTTVFRLRGKEKKKRFRDAGQIKFKSLRPYSFNFLSTRKLVSGQLYWVFRSIGTGAMRMYSIRAF